MLLIASVLAYFVVAALLGLAGRRLRSAAGVIAGAPFVAQMALLLSRPVVGPFEPVEVAWVPDLGLRFATRVDETSLLLLGVVATVGLVIVVYSNRYFADPAQRVRFLALLVLFTGGMVGIVTADEVFGLFVFWETTTVASFLLVGFDDTRAGARAAAIQAVLVTAIGGLAMLGGLVLLASQTGTTSLSAMVAAPPTGTVVTVAVGLVLVGVFTKSAQFPFHFWLPGAMAAPTPASAYLHSATMVKAGIVLLVFLAPGFASLGVWTWAVTGAGLVTMALGALQAMRQHDLKLLLAHGTVSQLGFMVALLGLGHVAAALVVLVAHAGFKATLFLVTGIIDKKTGTRDIRHLSGIRETSPTLAAVAGAATLSMAGIAPTIGFVTKEAAFDTLVKVGDWPPLAIIVVASVLTVAYSARFWWGAFEEQPGGVDVAHLGEIDKPLLAGPVALALASIIFGIWPGPLQTLVEAATGAKLKLVLWPGFTTALGLSTLVIAGGAAVHIVSHRTWLRQSWWSRSVVPVRLPSAQSSYARAVAGLNRIADGVTGVVQSGSLPVYIAVILSTVVGITGVVWLLEARVDVDIPIANSPAEVLLASVVIVVAVASTRTQRRMAAAMLLGAVGFGVAGVYVAFGAPDLALTQLLIEVFTVGLFAFVLARLPRRFGADPVSLSRAVRVGVSLGVGVFITAAALLMTGVDPARNTSAFYIDNSVGAGGKNVVNVILTDFRALDTLGEVTVLAGAAIGVAALVAGLTGRHTGDGDA